MRIAHFLQVARIAQRHGLTNVLRGIEDDLIATFRKTVQEVKQKSVKYRDPYSEVTQIFPIPTKEIMSHMPHNKLEAVKQYKALADCSIIHAKKIIEDYAHHVGLYPAHTPSGYCTFE